MESYRQWRRRAFPQVVFWEIIDRSWTPEEQNELAREWKAGRYVTEDGA